MKKLLFGLSALIFSLPALVVRADGELSNGITQLQNPLDPSGTGTVSDLLGKVIEYFNIIAAPVITIMVLYGAFQILFAQDNKTKYENGIKTIKHAAIGAAIVILADGILYVIRDALTI